MTKSLPLKLKNSMLILFLFFSFATAVGQEKECEFGGPPKLSELIGFWKKVEIPDEEKMNLTNPWPQKYQWFAFYENGTIYSMMSDVDTNYSVKELKEIFGNLPVEKTPNYKLEGQFLTVDNKEDKNYKELWGVNLFAIDINENLKKGNLMMTLDGGNDNIIYFRLLKKIETEEIKNTH